MDDSVTAATSRSRSPDSGRKRSHKSSSSGSSSDSSSDSSEDDHERRKRKKHKKEKKKHKSKSKSHKESKKKHKKEKKKHKKKSKSPHSDFGKYGVLQATDRYNKQQEFYAWLREVKGQEPEAQPPYQLEELFADFQEDYNTVTFPHKKYYNIEAWESKQAAKQAKLDKKGFAVTAAAQEANAGAFNILNDEAEKRRGHKARNSMKISRAEVLEMEKVMRERDRNNIRKDLKLKVDDRAGVRTMSMMRGLMAPGVHKAV